MPALIPAQMLSAAIQHHRAGRLGEAERLYREVLEAQPEHADALHLLGVLAHQTGRQGLAVEMIERAIARNGSMPAFHNNLGNALAAAGRWPDAERAYRRAIEHKKDYAEAYYNLGGALRALGKLAETEETYRHALALRPGHPGTLLNLSEVLQARGELEAAAEICQRAITADPRLAAAFNNLGNIRSAQGRFEEALAAYSRAIELDPRLAEAHHNRAIALLNGGRIEEAVASCRQALIKRPQFVAAFVTLGHALAQSGEAQEARQAYRSALALDPTCGEARLGETVAAIPILSSSPAESRQGVASFDHGLQELRAWVAANPGGLGEAIGRVQPFYLPYRDTDVTVTLSRYGDLAFEEATAHWQPPPLAARPHHGGDRPIRLLIVSGHVRRHPVWDVILRGLIAAMDGKAVEVWLLHTGTRVDEETEWARSRVARFIQGPKPVRGWLEEIARASPEVIYYPEIGMDPATCTLAALRLAPLQIASWGHPVTSGLPSIDWFVSGELLEGADADGHYREKLVRLPGNGVLTEPVAGRKEPWAGPARPPGTVRFALCQQPIKFDPRDDELLVRIARETGNAEFWLAAPANMAWTASRLRERLASAFKADGLDPDAFLRITPWLAREQFLGFLEQMDISLDAPAFSGYTTAWQALQAGLPIVTLEGRFLRQRLAAGLLRRVGETDGLTRSRDQYVEKAVEWARESRDPDRWAARRERLRLAAPLADGNRDAILDFEQRLRQALR